MMATVHEATVATARGETDGNSAHVENVLPFAVARLKAGQQVCLVTLVAVDGSTPRAVGAQMAVSSDGQSVGSFTGGCLEGAVAAEALRVMETGQCATIRFGKGSPYFDIVLPCGSGLDLHFDPHPDATLLRSILARQAGRKPASIRLNYTPPNQVGLGASDGLPKTVREFERWYLPKTRLLIAGDSPAMPILAELAHQSDLEVIELRYEMPFDAYDGFDRWSGVALLFHDHEKEDFFLTRALRSDCFFVGALGSHRTHKARLARLSATGSTPEELNRIRSPIGLIPGAKSPAELAVSVLAEVIDEARSLRHPNNG